MSNILKTEELEGGAEILYPSHEEAFAVALSDLFPIEDILIGSSVILLSIKILHARFLDS